MKVHFKRMTAVLLAVVLSLCLSLTAFATEGADVETGDLTVTGEQLGGKEVTAVRMFKVHATEGDTENSYVFDSYELEDAWLGFFQDETGAGIGKDALSKVPGVTFSEEPTDAEYKAAAVAYVQTLTNDSQNKGTLADFAHKAQKWYRAHKNVQVSGFSGLTTTEKAPEVQAPETKSSVTFKGLPSGYYLVFPEMGGTGENERNTDAMLINIPTTNEGTTWNIKSTYPTVDKTVDDGNDNTPGKEEGSNDADNGSAQVGDVVTFTLTSKVPDMTDFEKYYFAFKDTLSNGLELVTAGDTFAKTDVEVYIYNAENGTADEAHKIGVDSFAATFADNQLNIVFDNLKTVQSNNEDIETGDTIQVIYKAKITEGAVVNKPASNSVEVEYSNDPTGTGHGTSTPDESKVYTYEINLKKYYLKETESEGGLEVGVDDNYDGNHHLEVSSLSDGKSAVEEFLSGAEFVLSKSETLQGDGSTDPNVVKLVKTADNTYRVAKEGEASITTSFTTGNDLIKISGLEAGTYYLHEINAPVGYNKLTEPVKIQIIVDPDQATKVDPEGNHEDVSYENPLYVVNGKPNTGADNTVKVENKKGVTLPETGGIGTIGLTALGVVVVVAGLFVFPRKKKNKQD